MHVSAEPEYVAGDGGTGLPGLHGSPWRQIECQAAFGSRAQREFYIDDPWVGAEHREDAAPEPLGRSIPERETDADTMIRRLRGVVEHGGDQHTLVTLERHAKDERRDIECGRLLRDRQNMQGTRQKEIASIRIAQVDVVQERPRQLVTGAVDDRAVDAIDRAAGGDHHLLHGQTDHTHAARCRLEIDRNRLDHERVVRGVEGRACPRQRRQIRDCWAGQHAQHECYETNHGLSIWPRRGSFSKAWSRSLCARLDVTFEPSRIVNTYSPCPCGSSLRTWLMLTMTERCTRIKRSGCNFPMQAFIVSRTKWTRPPACNRT